VPSWLNKSVIEVRHTKFKQEVAYVGISSNKQVQGMKDMIEFKENQDHRASFQEYKHKRGVLEQQSIYGIRRTHAAMHNYQPKAMRNNLWLAKSRKEVEEGGVARLSDEKTFQERIRCDGKVKSNEQKIMFKPTSDEK